MSVPKTLGPYNSTSTPALAAGAAIGVAVDPSTVAIQVHNDSPYRVYVAFDGALPTAAVATSGAYQGIAGPYGHPVIMVRSQYQSPFLGMVWLMPIDLSSNQALAGTISSLAEIHVDTFGPGDELPQSWAMPRQQDASSQTRVIAVPPAGGQILPGSWDTSVFSTLRIITFTLSATNIALQAVNLYIFHLGLFPQIPAASGFQQTRCAIQGQFLDSNSGNVGTPATIYLFPALSYLTSGNAVGTVPIVVAPFFPIVRTMTPPPTAAYLAINLVKVGGTDTVLEFNTQMVVDPNNAGPPASYGGNDSPQRWAGQYSSIAGIW